MDITDPSLRYQFEELHEAKELVDLCATRFRGYEYLAKHHSITGGCFDYSELVRTGELFESALDNWMAFFQMYRDMHWSGGAGNAFSDTSANRFAYYFLFLHLYRQAIVQDYDCRQSTWYSQTSRRIEGLAGVIRKYLSFVEMDNL
jgi:hypothetical protein